MPLLEISNLSRQFGGLTALRDFSLALDSGQLVGLIGPNGAGKTTAFNIITGIFPPSAGDVRLAGRSIIGLPPHRISHGGVARTFQNIRLFGALSVLDNVLVGFNTGLINALVGAWLRSPNAQRRDDRQKTDAMDLLEMLQLADRATDLARSLSYGQQRRLEIARALATRPKVLLLDEPAAGMNPQEKLALMELIRFIRDRFNLGILLIEHDMKLVMTVCERITVLDHGQTIAAGTPSQVQADPKVIEAYLGEPPQKSQI